MFTAFAVFAIVVMIMFGIFYLKARSTEPAAESKKKNPDDCGNAGFPMASMSAGDNCSLGDAAGCDGGGGGD
ncbi:hypothetical protein [Sphingorhabdus sp.]|uniref:hypothetical protein n=1 Tax=Sphingorhabdus sp. TaxID=1902408 RepID=UPI0039835A18